MGGCACVRMNGFLVGKSMANYKDSKQSSVYAIRGRQREGRDETDLQTAQGAE